MARNLMDIWVRNAPDVIHRMRGFDARLRRRIHVIIGRHAAEQYAMTYDRCPKDTYFMANHIRVDWSPGGYAYEMGWRHADFAAKGLAPYYWFQELGFHHYLSGRFIQNPSLVPVQAILAPKLERDVRRAVIAEARRHG